MKRKTKGKMIRIAAICLILAGLGTAAWFGWKAYSTQKEYQVGNDAYEQLADLVKDDGEPDESPASSDSESTEETNPETEVPEVNLEAAQEVNENIVAWLYCPDTVIDYPVCYGDDNYYYLYHLADGTYNRNGCLFIDCDDRGDFFNDNTIIYGHHMASGKMFASLIKYADQSYYDAHPVMYLTIGDEQYELEIFSGYVTTLDSSAYKINLGTKHEFAEWLKEISEKSDFTPRAMTLSTDDRIVTLSTCAYNFQNARYVVHGRLVELDDQQ